VTPPARTRRGVRARWRAARPDERLARELARALGLPPLVGRLLVNRGVRDLDEAERFLAPSLQGLHDPLGLADMDRAAGRLAAAIRARESILIFGDRDVDGLTASALLVAFLQGLGVEAELHVPNRSTGGYSFSDEAVADILARGSDLVVSVDNGTTRAGPVAALQRAGVDVIITDHHLPDAELAPAHALVNPRRRDCGYPFKGLAGVGVAFKLACAVAERLSEGARRSSRMTRFLQDAMAWVALGTVADMVPLVDENRALVALGLPAIPRSPHPGLRALCEVCRVDADDFRAETIAFQLAPRLNAAGRLGREELSIELLTTADPTRAGRLAGSLDQINTERKQLDRRLFEALEPVVAARDDDGAIALAGDDWPPGLLGLVAGRLARQFHRPAVLVTRGTHPAKGSCRSIAGYDVHAALAACDAHLIEHGGHAMAAGLTLAHDDVDAFLEAFGARWRRALDEGFEPPARTFDGELPLAALTRPLIAAIDRLEPFGQGNPAPVLACRGLSVERTQTMGRDGAHLDLRLHQGPVRRRAVAFGRGQLAARLRPGQTVDVLFTPKLNRFAGRHDVEMDVVEIQASRAGGPAGAASPVS